ncbi:MAG TPA: ABC transporter ATP-binding protein [Chryseosolibacter sp.]
MNATMRYLTTTDLTIGYRQPTGQNILFERLNLSLSAGQMICFMGPNGAGKSSLLRALAGLQKPLAGTIRIEGGGKTENIPTQVAVVLTDRIYGLNLTVEEIVAFGRYPYLGWNIRLSKEDEEKIQAAIEQIHLQPLLRKKLYQLSDGQLQMTMIARALAQDTPVILLDEPTAHLDLNNRVEIMDLLLKLTRDTGKAVLLATHELDLALQTADLIWLTGKNRNILTGLPEDLVLNGSFDEIFDLKGFDLKTGKVRHHPFRNVAIQLAGAGAEYLWTKNALERNGFGIAHDQQEISVTLTGDPLPLRWVIKRKDGVNEADSIESLLKLLEQTIAARHP